MAFFQYIHDDERVQRLVRELRKWPSVSSHGEIMNRSKIIILEIMKHTFPPTLSYCYQQKWPKRASIWNFQMTLQTKAEATVERSIPILTECRNKSINRMYIARQDLKIEVEHNHLGKLSKALQKTSILLTESCTKFMHG